MTTRLLIALAALLSLALVAGIMSQRFFSSRTVLGGHSGVGGTKGVRVVDNVTDGAIAFGELSATVPTASGDIAADEGAIVWSVYTSDHTLSPSDSIQWHERNTNVHAYYYLVASHDPVSVISRGVTYSWTPDDWLMLKSPSSETNHYFPIAFTASLSPSVTTITPPISMDAESQGTAGIPYVVSDGATASVGTHLLYFAFDNDSKRLCLDDDPDMAEAVDSANGLTSLSRPALEQPYAQGACLESAGDSFTFRGTSFVILSDPKTMTPAVSTVYFAMGYFCPYAPSVGDCAQGVYTAIAVPDTFPGGSALNWTLTIVGVQHSEP